MKTTKETNDSRKRTFGEFQEFLAKDPFGVSVATASPKDVAAFIHSEWLPNHSGSCRTILPQTGQPVASASAVRGVVKDISKSYTLLGFDGAKTRSELMKSYRDGDGNLLHHQGVKVQRAKVFSESKLDVLVAYLTSKLLASEGIEKCVVAMDRAAVLYLWETLACGGKNVVLSDKTRLMPRRGLFIRGGPRQSAMNRLHGLSWRSLRGLPG
jgi:hypothetical protein